MKTYLQILGITILSLYAVVSFISLVPNPFAWEIGGRMAFTFFSLFFSFVSYSIIDASKK